MSDTRVDTTPAALEDLAADAGLKVRGLVRVQREDGLPTLPDGRAVQTLALLGWTGRSGFDVFAAAAEFSDGERDPLDRWSRRVIAAIASRLGGLALYPFGGPPHHPFQRWAVRAEGLSSSPLGLLIHPRFGLWHSYRGAIALAEPFAPDPPAPAHSPCETCRGRPCLTACPVGAFTPAGYDVDRCATHLASPAGRACMEGGCLARRACPVAPEHGYAGDQAAFYMRAFLAAHPPG